MERLSAIDIWIDFWKAYFAVVGEIMGRLTYLERNINIQRERIDSIERRMD